MKKIVVAVSMMVLLGSTFAVAAPGFAGKKITNSKLVQAQQNTNVDFAGVRFFIPKGQTVILGQRDNGSIILRGRDLKDIKIYGASLSTQGNSVLSIYPSSRVAFLHRGETMTVIDPLGHTSTVSVDGAISTQDATINSNTVAQLKEQAKEESAQVNQALGEDAELPAFVAATATSETATEQADQNVEETEKTLSPSAPR